MLEVVPRLPAQAPPSTFIDIYPSDARKHFPAAALVFPFVLRNMSLHHQRGIHTQLGQVLRRKWRTCTDDISTESQFGRTFIRQKVRLYSIFKIHSSKQILV